MSKNTLLKLIKYGLGIFLIYGAYYVGTRIEFEDPFKPTPIFKGLNMTEDERQKNQLEAVSMTPEAAQLQYKAFENLIKIMDKHGIDYWLCCGTLLGAVRHEGIIPYDDDVDVFINEKDGDKALGLKDELKAVGLGIYQDRTSIKVYQLDGYHVRPRRKSFKVLPGVWFVRRKVEKFPCIDLFTSKVEKGKYIHANYRAYRVFAKETFGEGDVYPLKEYQFGPLKVKGPQSPMNHLDSTYGKDWDKYLVFGSNHSYSSNIKFKLPLTEELKKYCYRYGTQEN